MNSQEYQELRADNLALREDNLVLRTEIAEIKAMMMQLVAADQLVSIDVAAEMMGCSQSTIRRRINSGELHNYAPPRKAIKVKISELMTPRSRGKLSALSIL